MLNWIKAVVSIALLIAGLFGLVYLVSVYPPTMYLIFGVVLAMWIKAAKDSFDFADLMKTLKK